MRVLILLLTMAPYLGCQEKIYTDEEPVVPDKPAENKLPAIKIPEAKESFLEDHLKNKHSDPNVISESWPKIEFNAEPDLSRYGIVEEKLTLEILSENRPKPYAFLSVLLSSLEREDVEIGFFSEEPSFGVEVENVSPKKDGSCEFETNYKINQWFVTHDKDNHGEMKVYEIKQGKIERELAIRQSNDVGFFTMQPEQTVLVRWFYSHELGDSPRMLLDGVLPSTSSCTHEKYRDFYKRCYKTRYPLYFIDTCDEFTQMDAVKYAIVQPLKLTYFAQKPGNEDFKNQKVAKFNVQKPPMVLMPDPSRLHQPNKNPSPSPALHP